MTSISKIEKYLFYSALALVVYMPLHVFISQSASLLTGGLDVWKAAKDVLLVLLVPFLLYVSYVRGYLQSSKFLRYFIISGGLYVLLHFIFLLFYRDFTGTYAAIIGSVYNTRIFGFLLLGYLVGKSKKSREYIKVLSTVAVLVATLVSIFGVLQYFLPHDLLENVGYSVERGVKPMFFIDDKPDFPRVMSTLRDPNSLGAYLLIPLSFVSLALMSKKYNAALFIRPFRKKALIFMLVIMAACLLLTFSRGSFLASFVVLFSGLMFAKGKFVFRYLRVHWFEILLTLLIIGGIGLALKDTYAYKNIVLHADESTTKADPNEKRLILYEEAVENIQEQPAGYGPGSAGIVSVKSDAGQRLTENYALQIAHELGIFGAVLFIAISAGLFVYLIQIYRATSSPLALIVLATYVGYMFYGLLVHIWSNEAVALQWWLFAGLVTGYLEDH